jgi:flagellar motility protein MotE (MotC chaperone)
MESTENVKPMESPEVVAKSMEIIEKGTPLLTDEKQTEYFKGVLESLKTADGLVDNKEKATRMQDAAVKFANQLCFILFREDTITKELTDLLRSLPTPETTTELVKEFTDAREARIKALNGAHAAIMDEQKNLDIFLGVIAGMSPEEAARRMKEHDDQVKAQLNRQG